VVTALSYKKRTQPVTEDISTVFVVEREILPPPIFIPTRD
jgi:hypothetical protein